MHKGDTSNKYMRLLPFQNEAIELILERYNSGKKSALLIMPAGTGKTTLSAHLIERLVDDHKLDSIAYVTSTKAMQSFFGSVVNETLNSNSEIVRTYSYAELTELIEKNCIEPDEFQFLVFDDLDDSGQSTVATIFAYFNGFKIGFSRTDTQNERSVFQTDDEGGVVYKYSLEQAARDGLFFESQNTFFRRVFNNVEIQFTKIEAEKEWSQTDRQEFIEQIDTFRSESAEYVRVQEDLRSGKIDPADVLEMTHRKEQQEEFKQLLNDKKYFDERAEELNGEESVWQNYFEANPWIFGFGLNYIFNSPLVGKKLEQTVEGYSVKGHGKRTDALLKTTGLVQTLCFGEIKTHRKTLLKATRNPYRSESWAISDELAGGISQIHRTVDSSLRNLGNALSINDEDGFKLRDSIYLYRPKAFLIIGSLDEFKNRNGNIHEDKFSSFELFRRAISDIEIITFDELYERAYALIRKKWNKSGPVNEH